MAAPTTLPKAAIVPYGTNEDSIIYVSRNWSELKLLLTNPVGYLSVQAMANSPMQWTLRTPAVAIIEPFDSNPKTTLRFMSLFENEFKGMSDGAPTQGDMAAHQFVRALADHKIERAFADQTDNSPNPIADGCFVAEFALNTGVLNIRYKVPNKFRAPTKGDDQFNFKGKLTKTTLIQVGELPVGNIHFDIEKEYAKGEVNRADLILDMIENPYRLTLLQKEHESTRAELAEVTPGTTLPVNRTALKNNPKFHFDHVRPPITVEKMSGSILEDGCGLCIDGQTYQETIDGEEVWVIAGVVYKCYMAPGP
jgi:hypothetical protein